MSTPIKFFIGKNARKERDSHPDWKASKPVEINGKRYWASGWTGSNQHGEYISISLQEVEERPQEQRQPSRAGRPAQSIPDDDSLPF